METNPKKETVNEKQNPEKLKHVAAGSPSASGPKHEGKHRDDSKKASARLEREAEEEFEKHNTSQHSGYNESDGDQPVEKVNLDDVEENTAD